MELGKGSIFKVGLILMLSMSLILDGKLLTAPCSWELTLDNCQVGSEAYNLAVWGGNLGNVCMHACMYACTKVKCLGMKLSWLRNPATPNWAHSAANMIVGFRSIAPWIYLPAPLLHEYTYPQDHEYVIRATNRCLHVPPHNMQFEQFETDLVLFPHGNKVTHLLSWFFILD